MQLRLLTLLLSFFFACYAQPTEPVVPLGSSQLKVASTTEYIQIASAIEAVKARLSQPLEKKPVLFDVNLPATFFGSPGLFQDRAESIYYYRKLIELKSKRPRAPPV